MRTDRNDEASGRVSQFCERPYKQHLEGQVPYILYATFITEPLTI